MYILALILLLQNPAVSNAVQAQGSQPNTLPNSLLVALLSVVFSVIVGGGGVAWWLRSGTTMKVAEINATSALAKADTLVTQAATLAIQTGQHEALIQEIRTRMGKLDKIDEMATTVAFMKEATSNIVSHMVPRAEIERKWNSDDEKFASLADDIDDLRKQQKTL